MKKLSLLIGGLLFSGLMMAQTGLENEKGMITLEGQTTIGGVVMSKRLAPSVRFRIFATDKLAFRGTFGLSNYTTKDEFYANEDNNSGAKGTYTAKNTVWNVAVGAEYHVEGTERVSPYIAVDLTYGAGKTIVDAVNANGSSYVANYSRDAELPNMRYGVAVMGGLDYNFSRRFYLGGEIGIQVTTRTRGEGKTTTVNNGVTVNQTSNMIKYGTASDLIAAIRLGFRF